jgi:glycosyltransferase domain-containing protein
MLTIVIPTYNRPNELRRLLEFQRSSASISIIVLDGSTENIGLINSQVCHSFKCVEHYKFPSSMHLGLRLSAGLKMVKTPFVAFCGDDDFLFPAAAVECAAFLQNNDGFAAAIGQVWTMQYFAEKHILRRGAAFGKGLDFGTRFDHSRFIQRAFFYFAYTLLGSIPLFYAVRRTEQAQQAFSLINDSLKYSSMELLTNCSLLIEGKVAKLPIAFGVRDYASETTRDPERDGVSEYIPSVDIEYIRPILVDALMRSEKLPYERAQYSIDSLLALWTDSVAATQMLVEPKLSKKIKSLVVYTQCLLSPIFPKVIARFLGFPPDIYENLVLSHRKFTSK